MTDGGCNVASDGDGFNGETTYTSRKEDDVIGWCNRRESRRSKGISLNVGKRRGVKLMYDLVIVLVAFHKFKRKGQGEDIEQGFNLHEDVTFRADGFMGSKILVFLMKMELGEKTLTIKMDGHLREWSWSRAIACGKMEIQE